VDDFIKHCTENNVPFDFVSTHVYGNDLSTDVFGTKEDIPRDKMVCRAVKKVHEQIQRSPRPAVPLIWSEFNASYMSEPAVTDTVYMGPWMADTIRQCDGMVDVMSYWTFSDVFEEPGVVQKPFYGGFGLIAAGGIPKPAFNAFRLLHQLGDVRLALDSGSALVTRRADGSLVLALWNYAAPDAAGEAKTVTVSFRNTKAHQAQVWRLDSDHGNSTGAYYQMGQPRYPTQAQIQQLRSAADLGSPESRDLGNGPLALQIPAHGLVLVELQ